MTNIEAEPTNKNTAQNTKIAMLSKPLFAAILIPLLGFLCYGVPYITGLSYHQTYLNSFGIPIGLFPNNPIDNLTSSYIALIIALQDCLTLIKKPYAWIFATASIAALITYILILNKISNITIPENITKKLPKSKALRTPATILLISLTSSLLLLLIPITTTPFLSLPVLLGNYSAEIAAKRDKKNFIRGCQAQSRESDRCYTLRDKYTRIATGNIISTSDTRIAIFNDGAVEIYNLDGITLEMIIPSKNNTPASP
ncbi:hypothetical protein [Pseudomonas citronellolis]|uniref:hypothetical protein n=1 Tax=Pseudomonas citronellolis TaxID=53408 RepID=UPI00209E233A|nr:hypothetical protein [Pseudomonas citronellolis]MCP1644204.1 hypothetical protein [Pseudomonas citronellolis]MCP1666976.1 hypothetical protein [Pseudomonas citronellolis]MCP1697885.1 hypothetical protein [Pseudomonas citronellolis]MCP1704515.1 hypothetical protein [Pseudomonas citronellolis]MCP1798628.1 hypothetical protein [Pseudomonas citronellolis]